MQKRLRLLLAPLLLALVLVCPVRAAGPASSDLMPGMDVSVYQGNVDFTAAHASGLEAVYIRAGYGNGGVDSQFYRNVEAVKDSGLHFGFYYYVTARTESEAVGQARAFAALIDQTGYDCRPAMDFEELYGLSSAQASGIAVAFLTILENLTGHQPMLYSDTDSANTMFTPEVAAWPLWVAEYGPSEPSLTGPWTVWTGFQYSDEGQAPGVQDRVDLDHFTTGVLLQSQSLPLTYTVKPGDTLWALSLRYHTTISALVRQNHIANPNLIYVGQILQIPGGETPYFTYTIHPGDTLWGIAQRYDTSVTRLVQINGVQNPSLIYAGNTLKIPQ